MVTIQLSDELVEQARRLLQAETDQEAVEKAVQQFVRATAGKELLELRGKIDWEGNLDVMRTQEL